MSEGAGVKKCSRCERQREDAGESGTESREGGIRDHQHHLRRGFPTPPLYDVTAQSVTSLRSLRPHPHVLSQLFIDTAEILALRKDGMCGRREEEKGDTLRVKDKGGTIG
ncbi:hypothetical protein Pcinc_036648 [Petrolisthes cinctipes]|uniref:Uncharacterized protein n=1 Tax=Petrolisthes cinctipes TaxID=88211 RepID=A0AAE1BV80_PETCI|nr:hypothetical protein Pcinc_036648 [Petrolisthes cinctipes]